MSIRLHQVSKKYGDQQAVNQISFEVSKGQVVGFLGPNGAGKSTTMKMITGIIQPDQGFIEVCGMQVKGESLATKKKIGYLPEHNPDSSKRRLDTDAEANTIFGIVYEFFRAPKVI